MPIKMTKVTQTAIIGEHMQQRGASPTAGENVLETSTLEHVAISRKAEKRRAPWRSNAKVDTRPRYTCLGAQEHMYKNVHDRLYFF